MSDQCDSYISPENGGFDVRWVRFPKHIPHYSNWNLWVSGILLIGFRDDSEN